MCGIVGYFGEDRPPAEAETLRRRMAAAVAHRGIDERGVHVAPGDGDVQLLAHLCTSQAGTLPVAVSETGAC